MANETKDADTELRLLTSIREITQAEFCRYSTLEAWRHREFLLDQLDAARKERDEMKALGRELIPTLDEFTRLIKKTVIPPTGVPLTEIRDTVLRMGLADKAFDDRCNRPNELTAAQREAIDAELDKADAALKSLGSQLVKTELDSGS